MTAPRSWLVDAAERVVRAFIVAFAGQMLLSSTGVLSVSAAKAAAGAGVAAALSVVISLGAAQMGGTVSPASLVKQPVAQEPAALVAQAPQFPPLPVLAAAVADEVIRQLNQRAAVAARPKAHR